MVVNSGSNPAVRPKTNVTCAVSDPSCVWSGKIRLHPEVLRHGKTNQPKGHANESRALPSRAYQQETSDSPNGCSSRSNLASPYPWLWGTRDPVWSPIWTLLAPAQRPAMDFDLVALNATGFETKLRLEHLRSDKGGHQRKARLAANLNHRPRTRHSVEREGLRTSQSVLWASGRSRGVSIFLRDVLSFSCPLCCEVPVQQRLCVWIFVSPVNLHCMARPMLWQSENCCCVAYTLDTHYEDSFSLLCGAKTKTKSWIAVLMTRVCQLWKKTRYICIPYFLCTFFLEGSVHGVGQLAAKCWEKESGCVLLLTKRRVREPAGRAEWHSAPSAWARCPVQSGLCGSAAMGRHFKEGIPPVRILFLVCLKLFPCAWGNHVLH